MLVRLALLFTLLCGRGICLDVCTTNKYLRRSFVFKNNPNLGLTDNQCMAKVVPGAWCNWEPLETGHGVTSCQKGLNIRWRRRVCECPPPRPLSDPKIWCRMPRNYSLVAQLKDASLTKLEALKPEVWISDQHWELKRPLSRLSPVTNSLLGCLKFDECYFHTGGTYSGNVAVTRTGSKCLPWSNFTTNLTSAGLVKDKRTAFLDTQPKNYCRNPFVELAHTSYTSARLKPWCFTKAGWEYCDIRACGSVQFLGNFAFPDMPRIEQYSRMMYSMGTGFPDRSFDVNAESCFATCRFRCDKYAVLNVRKLGSYKQFRACQCFGEENIPNPNQYFNKRNIDQFTIAQSHEYNKNFGYDVTTGPFVKLEWRRCYLYNSMFSCPFIDDENSVFVAGTVFELALPRNCYEINHLVSNNSKSTMTVFGSMGNFKLHGTYDSSDRNWVLMSSRGKHVSTITTMCSHASQKATLCASFVSSSRHDPNSYFNHVVDADYHWVIIDIGNHEPIAVLELNGAPADLLPLEVFVRSAPLPNWLKEVDFTTATGHSGKRTEYFGRATRTEQMLWWRCEDVKQSGATLYTECTPHQKTRWIMLRLKVHTDMLEMKYNLGYNWIRPIESCCINVLRVNVLKLPADRLNCLVMHHPSMGLQHADYWEDQFSFDEDGQPLDPPIITPVHPQFNLPLLTHDSIHHEEKFLQEDWDVEACGDWEMLENTAIVGVPAKLKITFTVDDTRGKKCYNRTQVIHPESGLPCMRTVYFRVDAQSEEVVHYPDFGRSYDLTGSVKNCQFVCAIARECKAFEFSLLEFCRLHLISYKLDTMFVYSQNVIYGRKSDIMRTTNPFTWNNPFHPYHRLLKDLLSDAGFAH